MIELKGISRHYKTGPETVKALDEIDLVIARGQYTVLMGPSGSGKSTLLNILGCLDRPTAGRYTLDGVEVTALPDRKLVLMRRHKLGFIFQTFHLVARMSALRNVEFPMMFSGVPSKERRDRAMASLEKVGLKARALHRPDELSGGERQRVAIARALVMNPAVLLADEPTGNLDTTTGQDIVNLLLDLSRRGETVVMVTHDERYAGIGNALVRLRDGRVDEEVRT
ncbi:MAG: ABC transporter ATP-binding protein [Planctomycetota bacterium]|jgi:putative ABC transport system ATP-binding protein